MGRQSADKPVGPILSGYESPEMVEYMRRLAMRRSAMKQTGTRGPDGWVDPRPLDHEPIRFEVVKHKPWWRRWYVDVAIMTLLGMALAAVFWSGFTGCGL